MDITLSEAAYWLLLTQPVAAAIGVWFNVVSSMDAYRVYRFNKNGNGVRALVAQVQTEWELVRLVCLVLLFVTGALGIFNERPLGDQPWIVVINRACIVVVTGLLAMKTILGQRYRHRIIQRWIHEYHDQAASSEKLAHIEEVAVATLETTKVVDRKIDTIVEPKP